MHEWIYGKGHPVDNEDTYLGVYLKHNKSVLEYFKNRPNDLLCLPLDEKLSDHELWKKLCDFLEKDVPNEKFPYSNRKQDRFFLNYLRQLKHRLFGKEPISVLGLKIGKDYRAAKNNEL